VDSDDWLLDSKPRAKGKVDSDGDSRKVVQSRAKGKTEERESELYPELEMVEVRWMKAFAVTLDGGNDDSSAEFELED
jgi:hypothetical protein